MPLRLQQPVFLSLLSRLFRFPPSVRLLPLYHSRNVEIRFFPPVKFRSQLIPPVHEKMLRPFLVSEGGHWTLSKDGSSLERNVEFSNFEETKVGNSTVFLFRACMPDCPQDIRVGGQGQWICITDMVTWLI